MKGKNNRIEKHLFIVGVLILWAVLAPISGAEASDTVTVFAAASTTNAMRDIADLYRTKHKGRIRFSFAASSTLAKQIDNGAPADIYLSANRKWMDYLASEKLISPGSRVDILGNRIVLVAPLESPCEHIPVAPGFPLVDYLGNGRLAMGDPEHVPAGIYGKEALMKLNIWPSIKSKVAGMKDVRAALMMVERGEVPLGIVYSTDAAITDKVRVVGAFPPGTHSPIVYPVAVVADRVRPAVKKFMAFLRSPEATAVFERYGFKVP